MTLIDFLRMILIDFFLQQMKVVVVVVGVVADDDHCKHQTFVGTAALKTQLNMIEIVVMADLQVEYVVVEQAVRVVSKLV
jgi:hypothetical protein